MHNTYTHTLDVRAHIHTYMRKKQTDHAYAHTIKQKTNKTNKYDRAKHTESKTNMSNTNMKSKYRKHLYTTQGATERMNNQMHQAVREGTHGSTKEHSNK